MGRREEESKRTREQEQTLVTFIVYVEREMYMSTMKTHTGCRWRSYSTSFEAS